MDLFIHIVSYPLFFMSLGLGIFLSTSETSILLLGIIASSSLAALMHLSYCIKKGGFAPGVDDNCYIETDTIGNIRLRNLLVNFNPLRMENMIIVALFSAALNLLGYFLVAYAMGYSVALVLRFGIVYKSL